jgi:hypothetical protein
MSTLKSMPLVFGGVALLFVIAACLSSVCSTTEARAAADTQQVPQIKDLLREKHSALQEIASHVKSRWKDGRASLNEVYQANPAAFKAELELCDTDMERITVLEKMLGDAKEQEKAVKAQRESGAAVASDVLIAKVERLDVEIALARAKAKSL